jgi:hypothetical protein
MNPEAARLRQRQEGSSSSNISPWERWGPYVSERGWGNVREDYSEDGDAWNYFSHEQARLRTYRWCEDGIAGISDRYQILLFASAFWNGCDPILKERLYGLNSSEGNHGEDVKECYYYLDATPTHSYLKYLYKYPQTPYPYDQLLEENRKRGLKDREFELVDTGIFNEDRYFDIFIEYAKADMEDICIRIEAFNRGPDPAELHILPHLWFRNEWAWTVPRQKEPIIRLEKNDLPCLVADDTEKKSPKFLLFEYYLGPYYLYGSAGGTPLFTNNESNQETLWEKPNETPFVKDAFHRYLIEQQTGAINPKSMGTKAALHYHFPSIAPGKSASVHLRLTKKKVKEPLLDVETIIEKRKKEADLFYDKIHPEKANKEEKAIQRQALAGMIWNKQSYIFDVDTWLNGDDPENPPPLNHQKIRNMHWRHITSLRIFSMPDKWEFPWFAAWDLAFHTVAYSLIDLEFAKDQLWLLLFDQFQHPNGAIPAYEWSFDDVNPPVQAWAALKIFECEKKNTGREDYDFLEKCFHKLLMNFSWWINRVDAQGNNVFEGGFLGMDNIGFLDRSEKLPEGYSLDQADGSGWVSHLCLNLMRIALILAKKNRNYEGLGIKFFQHFIYVTATMRKGHGRSYDMWNDEVGFFHTHLRRPDGSAEEIFIRSLEGIIPFFACDVWDEEELKSFPVFYDSYLWMLQNRPDLTSKCVQKIPHKKGTHHLLGLLSKSELQRFLTTIWDPKEFRSDYGLRSLSKYHEKHPAVWSDHTIYYEPGEAQQKIKGGNSNWRGPIWFPLNFLLIDTLFLLGKTFQDDLLVRVGQEPAVNLQQMAESFANRLLNLFKKDAAGNRPMYGDYEKFQKDPHFKDYFFFYEHFHGNTGRGLGASNQTGWTGLIASLIDRFSDSKNDVRKPEKT